MPDVEALKKTVFFVTRIGDEGAEERVRSDDLMELLLEPAVQEFDPDLTVVRADQTAAYGKITDTIVHHLLFSAYIVVDATGRNPNVYYELGVAHAFHRPVILLVDDVKTIPFDTSGEAHLQLPGAGELGARTLATAKPLLLRALQAAKAANTPPGPVAAAQAQLTPPDISAGEATELLRKGLRELTDRVNYLELTTTLTSSPTALQGPAAARMMSFKTLMTALRNRSPREGSRIEYHGSHVEVTAKRAEGAPTGILLTLQGSSPIELLESTGKFLQIDPGYIEKVAQDAVALGLTIPILPTMR